MLSKWHAMLTYPVEPAPNAFGLQTLRKNIQLKRCAFSQLQLS